MKQHLRRLCAGAAAICLITGVFTAQPVAAQDYKNMQVEMTVGEHIRFGRIDEIREYLLANPDFSTLSSAVFDMRMVDKFLCDTASSKQAKVEIVEMFLDQGATADVDCVPIMPEMGVTPLLQASRGHMMSLPDYQHLDKAYSAPFFPPVRSPGSVYLEIADLLMDEIMDPDLSGILSESAGSRNVAFTKRLLNAGADPDRSTGKAISARAMVDARIAQTEEKLKRLGGGTP